MPRRDPFTAMCRQFASVAMPIVADLHTHTTVSDGEDTPSRLALRAKHAHLSTIAITDHDTLEGIAEAMSVPGIEIIPGVELSCSYRNREVHLLGLFVDPKHIELNLVCQQIGESRRLRFKSYIDNLKRIKIIIPAHRSEQVLSVSASPGRRHVANLIREIQPYRTRFAVFTDILPSIVEMVPPKRLLPTAEAIELIHRAQGIAILAHPPGEFDEKTFRELAELNLNGIESKHPNVSQKQTDFLERIAKMYNWVSTAGSDFHTTDIIDRKFGRIGMNATDFANLRRYAGR